MTPIRTLAEREDVFRAVAAAAARAREGRGGWLMVAAPPGRGRTAVLDEAVRRETGEGRLQARWARCAKEETAFPFALVRQLFPAAEDIPFAEPSGTEEQRIFHRLTDLLARAAVRRPVLLAVDDLHYADDASRRWTGYLARRIAGLPVLLLLTECREHPGITGLPPSTGTGVPLPPLSTKTVTRLARAHGLTTGQARTCAEATAGNPALLQALLADLAEAPDLAEVPYLAHGHPPGHPSETGPNRYRDTLVHWLRHHADHLTRHLCLALAVTAQGPGDATGLLREAAALCPDGRTEQVAGAPRYAELLRHPLARAAVLAAADPGELDALRTHVARRLDEQGAPAHAVAAHLLRLARPAEPWMTRTLEDAAEEALRNGGSAEAVALLRHALLGPLDPGRRAALTLRLGTLEFPHSAEAGIRRLRAALELHPDVRERAAAAPVLGAALAVRGRTDTALRVLRQAGGGAGDDEPAHVLRAVAALIASHDATAWRDAVAELRTMAPTAPAAVEPLVCGLVTEYEAGAGLVSAEEVLARVRPRLAAPVHPVLRTAWLGSAATLLQWADRLEEARSLALECLPAPPVPPDLTDVGVQCLLSVSAEAALWAGDFRRVVAENLPLVEACAGQGIRMPHLISMVALARHELGLRDQALEILAVPGEDRADSSWEWNELRYARAVLRAAEGHWRAALDDYLACGRAQGARDFVSPVATPWRSGAALALARLGRAPEARELAEEELRHARRWGTPRTVGRALRARAAALGGREALEALTEAAALLDGAPAPVERVEVLIDLGRARVAAGLGRKGREDLREAHARAARLPAPDPAGPGDVPVTGRLVRETRQALAAVGVRGAPHTRTGREALTAAERRVVALAVEGHSNAEIGAVLHLARRTVETHLTSAYRKLEVTRRTQLAASLNGALLDVASGG
ncbi:helix-turn-helix transcriptional regulator [Streptomyces albireticuli]|uniref:helix-turn-helix transcriptional regulator n=1 Tax=Streptomyces albireticuli TaxID=1940 RepID=UPI0014744B5E|nr:LuxR family transcriptional regulator [Streptomyces albireticuli]